MGLSDQVCGRWPSDAGPCGKPAADVLVFVHPWIPALLVCPEHLAEFVLEQGMLWSAGGAAA